MFLLKKVYNGACINTPDAIVHIGDEMDVSSVVKFVRESGYDINLSVRSGGHSFSCASSKVSSR